MGSSPIRSTSIFDVWNFLAFPQVVYLPQWTVDEEGRKKLADWIGIATGEASPWKIHNPGMRDYTVANFFNLNEADLV